MRKQARLDENQLEIVKALRQIPGCSVVSLARLGDGCPDLLVGYQGRNVLLEVKADKGLVRARQSALMTQWRGQVAIVRTVDQAIFEVTGQTWATHDPPLASETPKSRA